jgi:hypothetical protein
MSNVQRLLRQSVRHLVELAGHTEIVVEVQNGCIAHRTMRRDNNRDRVSPMGWERGRVSV